MVPLRMQPESYGAAIYTFELQSLIASSSPQFLLLRCCEVLLFCRLVSVILSPSDGCFLVSSGLRGKASCRKERSAVGLVLYGLLFIQSDGGGEGGPGAGGGWRLDAIRFRDFCF